MSNAQPPNLQNSTPPSAEEVLKREKDHIEVNRTDRMGVKSPMWSGIGLSGGGIRSASLSLGVIQGLAEANLLKYFDYISSVSGGGYIASSLQWWWLRASRDDLSSKPQPIFGLEPDDFPYGPAYPNGAPATPMSPAVAKQGAAPNVPNATLSQPIQVAAQNAPVPNPALRSRAIENLAFLRGHAAYLVPGNGLTAWSMLIVLIRTIVISLLTWIPLLTGVAALVYVFDVALLEPLAHKMNLWSPVGSLVPVQWTELCTASGIDCALKYPAFYAFLLHGFYLVAIMFISVAVLFGLLSRSPQDEQGRPARIAKLVAALSLTLALLATLIKSFGSHDGSLLLFIAGCLVFVALAVVTLVAEFMTSRSLNASYWLRRNLERLLGGAFLPTMTVFAIATVPILPYYLHNAQSTKYGTLGGALALIGGVGSALYGYYTFLRNLVPSLIGQIAATVGALLYLYITVVLAYVLALTLFNVSSGDVGTDDFADFVRLLLIGSILIALALGFRANINFVGLHRFYRDRLMEAFMPSDTSVLGKTSNFSPVADELSVADLAELSQIGLQSEGARPYPIVNCNAILVNDVNRKYASRGGDNFIISPLFVGSAATGWQDTSEYIKKNGPLTLASAMAASGAAATASAGYIGTGITMNPLVSAVMSILNVRLGLWIGNPFHQKPRRIKSIPTFLNPGLVSGVLGRAHKHDSGFIELTDGGHFENLALYELVRRQLDLILIVDGEADPNISLSSLVSASRRIEQDFEATLTFTNRSPDQLMMVPGQGYPTGVRYAQSPFLVGKIKYKGGGVGTLIYIKATLIKGMDFTTSGYLASNPDFPHQSTVDQFFDPDQFDAYRLLGYESVRKMISDLVLDTSIHNPSSIS